MFVAIIILQATRSSALRDSLRDKVAQVSGSLVFKMYAFNAARYQQYRDDCDLVHAWRIIPLAGYYMRDSIRSWKLLTDESRWVKCRLARDNVA